MKKNILTLMLVSGLSAFSFSQIAYQLPPRTVKHPAGMTGASAAGGVIENIQIPPADEYWLDYTLTFRPGFDWALAGTGRKHRGGKIPGLAGGTGTGGCSPIDPEGWSARQIWEGDGAAESYLYHQDRPGDCGDHFTFKYPDGALIIFQLGKVHRLTQRVKVNTPNVADGIVQVWVDGKLVFDKKNVRFRGAVPSSVARVSMLKYHSYFGGKSSDFYPDVDSYIDYGAMYVMSCAPDFSKPPGTCGCAGKSVTGISINKTSTSLQLCKTEQLNATVAPADACDGSLTWSSDKTNIATVDASGLVTAHATGTATITAKSNSGGFTKTCTVTVTDVQAAYNSITGTIPGRIEAEDYDTGGECVAYHDNIAGNNNQLYRNDDVDIKTTTDALGGGYDIGQGQNGEWLEYTLDATPGVYNVNARVGSAKTGNQLVIKLDGTTLGTITVPNLGNWSDKSTETIWGVNIPTGGKKVLRLEIVGDGVDINWVEFTDISTGIVSNEISPGISVYPNPMTGIFTINYPCTDCKNTIVSITDVYGRMILTKQYEAAEINDQIDLGEFSNGIYMLKLENENQEKTLKLVKQN